MALDLLAITFGGVAGWMLLCQRGLKRVSFAAAIAGLFLALALVAALLGILGNQLNLLIWLAWMTIAVWLWRVSSQLTGPAKVIGTLTWLMFMAAWVVTPLGAAVALINGSALLLLSPIWAWNVLSRSWS
jgi:hypothetical protein